MTVHAPTEQQTDSAAYARAIITAALQHRQAAPDHATRLSLFQLLETQVHAALDEANTAGVDAGHLVYCLAETSVELVIWCAQLLGDFEPEQLWGMIAQQLTATYSRPIPPLTQPSPSTAESPGRGRDPDQRAGSR